jgi:hypothetical protein
LTSRITWADAAYEVLKKAREPLKPNEIVEQAVRTSLLTRKTSANVQMASSIRQDMAQSKTAIQQPRFFSIGKGRYGLTEWLKGKKATIADLAFWILKSENRVLHYDEIASQIVKIRHLGKTPEIAVHSVLSKDKAFERFSKGSFGLKRWKPKVSPATRFVFGTPNEFWKMTQTLSKFLKGARQVVKICSPYVDKTTFDAFLARVPRQVETQLVVTKDIQWKDKVNRGLTGDFLQKFNANRRLITRRIDDLHSRFVVVDDSTVCLLSADLQKDQQTNRYQYAYFTSDPKITKPTLKYFGELWKSGSVCNLEAEARALAP